MTTPDENFPRGAYILYVVQTSQGNILNAIGVVKKAVKGRPYLRAEFSQLGGRISVNKEKVFVITKEDNPEYFI